jgi:hypothetical protein
MDFRGHIIETVDTLNQIEPTEVRVRSLAVIEGTPLYHRWESGDFVASNEDQMIEEIGMIIEGLTFDCEFETLQMTNSLFTLKGLLSTRKAAMLEMISFFGSLTPVQRALFLMERYLCGGYLDCVKAWGRYDGPLEEIIERARESIRINASDALLKVQQALFAIKAKGIP